MPHDKVVYFASRNRYTPAAWLARWRRHGALAMAQPLWVELVKYGQYDPIDGLTAAVNHRHGFDGVGLACFRGSIRALQSSAYAASLAVMLQDELEVFGTYVQGLSMVVREDVMVDGQADIKLFALLRGSATDALILAEYAHALLADAELGTLIKHLSVNTVIPAETAPVNIMSGFGGMLEMSFASVDDANRALNSTRNARIVSRLAGTAAGLNALLIPTRENLFLDRSRGINRSGELQAKFLQVR